MPDAEKILNVLSASLSVLLSASRAAHGRYQFAKQHGQTTDARKFLEEAASCRDRAHAVNPAHDDIAWLDDVAAKFEHEAICAFYAKQLAK